MTEYNLANGVVTLYAALAMAPLLSFQLSKRGQIVGAIAVMGFVGTFTVGAVVVTKYTVKTGISYIKHYIKNTKGDLLNY